jgi:hypothetical protein
MTFLGKILVMINLAISLLMAAMAFGLYVSGIDWTDKAAKEGQPAGKMQTLRKDIDDVLARLPLAERNWKAARADVFAREEIRQKERIWSDAEMAKLTGRKEKVYEVEPAAPGANPAARPTMNLNPILFAPAQPLVTREVYDERLDAHQKENTKIREDLAKKVKEDEDLTRKLAGDKEGDPEPRIRGIRRELVEERAKRLGLIDEQGITDSLQINVAVESELILKRLDDLDERIQELVRYLKKKHKVDVPSKWR